MKRSFYRRLCGLALAAALLLPLGACGKAPDPVDPNESWAPVGEDFFSFFMQTPLLLLSGYTVETFSDASKSAVALTWLCLHHEYDYTVGFQKEQFDMAVSHFFVEPVESYENGMTTILPSGNITATGWDYGGRQYYALKEAPVKDEEGKYTALFYHWTISEGALIDGLHPYTPQEAWDIISSGEGSTFDAPDIVQVEYLLTEPDEYWQAAFPEMPKQIKLCSLKVIAEKAEGPYTVYQQ